MRRHNMSSVSKKAEYEPMLTTQLPMEKCEPYYTASCHPPVSISNLPNVYETLASNDFEGNKDCNLSIFQYSEIPFS